MLNWIHLVWVLGAEQLPETSLHIYHVPLGLSVCLCNGDIVKVRKYIDEVFFIVKFINGLLKCCNSVSYSGIRASCYTRPFASKAVNGVSSSHVGYLVISTIQKFKVLCWQCQNILHIYAFYGGHSSFTKTAFVLQTDEFASIAPSVNKCLTFRDVDCWSALLRNLVIHTRFLNNRSSLWF